jgi:glutathione synthase/RimK-type ligase-like ATP-grasp enzyme
MRRCAFLTLEDPADFVIDDQLAYEPLTKLGWHAVAIPWSRPGVAWTAYDAVVIRSTWDYTARADQFVKALSEIEASGARLFNGVDIVRWNLDKRYLRELADRGTPIVPTVWRDQLRPGELPDLLAELDAEEIVVKPVVGANAQGAFRIHRRRLTSRLCRQIEVHYAQRALMAQPFLSDIVDEGEYSLFYFDGQLSHAILKTPRAGDFRVQEEHGGVIRPVTPGDVLRAAADIAVESIGQTLLYARVDLVRRPLGDGFQLMELELIEPALYLRMDAGAPRRFAEALDRCVGDPRAEPRQPTS